ncbi:hypothetical protein BOTBODRAFT_542987 [Botryobasidium botryosum FD-172 SS1]|uniref:Uncharacterized protein n=1 Tax=Botryobasidium botryosum (strain FD-172 SS1) TaxID=930990 RepID=A0A067MT74_BOTB1|nr:hypothetical protein BOTBODRAFT_542987 [Botryobasidium botryosum FD-172 SS1]
MPRRILHAAWARASRGELRFFRPRVKLSRQVYHHTTARRTGLCFTYLARTSTFSINTAWCFAFDQSTSPARSQA